MACELCRYLGWGSADLGRSRDDLITRDRRNPLGPGLPRRGPVAMSAMPSAAYRSAAVRQLSMSAKGSANRPTAFGMPAGLVAESAQHVNLMRENVERRRHAVPYAGVLSDESQQLLFSLPGGQNGCGLARLADRLRRLIAPFRRRAMIATPTSAYSSAERVVTTRHTFLQVRGVVAGGLRAVRRHWAAGPFDVTLRRLGNSVGTYQISVTEGGIRSGSRAPGR